MYIAAEKVFMIFKQTITQNVIVIIIIVLSS